MSEYYGKTEVVHVYGELKDVDECKRKLKEMLASDAP